MDEEVEIGTCGCCTKVIEFTEENRREDGWYYCPECVRLSNEEIERDRRLLALAVSG